MQLPVYCWSLSCEIARPRPRRPKRRIEECDFFADRLLCGMLPVVLSGADYSGRGKKLSTTR
jgi:hypothetical protein